MIIGQGRVLADGTANDLLARLPDQRAVCIVVPTAAAAARLPASCAHCPASPRCSRRRSTQGRTQVAPDAARRSAVLIEEVNGAAARATISRSPEVYRGRRHARRRVPPDHHRRAAAPPTVARASRKFKAHLQSPPPTPKRHAPNLDHRQARTRGLLRDARGVRLHRDLRRPDRRASPFYIGRFLDRNQASLEGFFSYHPWLYLLLVPAVAMRLWAEERKSGTIEQLLTLPVTTTEAVLGKFLAAWLFCGIALALTAPMWLTVNILGQPDNGAIAVGYFGSFLMAGAFLSIGICMSALTRNQIIAFIAGAVVCFLFTMSGLDLVLNFFRGWAPEMLDVDTIASFSFLSRFESLTHGVIDLRDVVFFVSLMAFWLFATVIAVDARKAA